MFGLHLVVMAVEDAALTIVVVYMSIKRDSLVRLVTTENALDAVDRGEISIRSNRSSTKWLDGGILRTKPRCFQGASSPALNRCEC